MKSACAAFLSHLAKAVAGVAILAMSSTALTLAFEKEINLWMSTPAVLLGQSGPAAQIVPASILAVRQENHGKPPSNKTRKVTPKMQFPARSMSHTRAHDRYAMHSIHS